MSSPKYCDDPAPHAGHEWAVDFEYGSSLHEKGFTTGTNYFYCWGIKPNDQLQIVLDVKGRYLAEVAGRLAGFDEAIALFSTKARRTETEFYEGDKP